MIARKHNGITRFLALTLSALILLGTVPMGVMPLIVSAVDSEYQIVRIADKEIYVYGAATVGEAAVTAEGIGTISYTGGGLAENSVLYIGGREMDPEGSGFSCNDTTITINYKDWLQYQTEWVAVKVSNNATVPSLKPISGIVITPYNAKYDGAEHDAVAVAGTISGDKITYSIDDGQTFDKNMPKIQYPGTKPVIVKIERKNHEVFVSGEYFAIVSNGEITNVQVIPYTGSYDGEAHNAVRVQGTKHGDVISYSTDSGSTFGSQVPTIKEVGTVNVIVKVQRTYFDTFVSDSATVQMLQGDISGVQVQGYHGTYDGVEHDAVASISGTESEDTVTYSKDNENFMRSMPKVKDCSDSGTYYVKIVRPGKNYKPLIIAFKIAISQAELTGITAKGYSGTYADAVNNEGVYEAVQHVAIESVTGQNSDDTVEYSSDNKNFSKVNPQVKNCSDSGTYHVKVTRNTSDGQPDPNYKPKVIQVSVVIQKAEITGVEAKGYQGARDEDYHNAIEVITGTRTDDKIMYAKKDGDFSDINPRVKSTYDSGTYSVKVQRLGGNYNDLIIKVTVLIIPNVQEIKFASDVNKQTLQIKYNDNNTFQNEIQEKGKGAEGVITYKIDESETTAECSINEKTGKVTYTHPGKIKVIAKIAACERYLPAETWYEVEISYVDVPAYVISSPVYTDDEYKWYNGVDGNNFTISASGWKVKEVSGKSGVWGWQDAFVESAEGKYSDYEFTFKNQNNEITSPVSVDPFAIDLDNPIVESITLTDKNTETIPTILRTLSFGLFFNEAVSVKVKCSDPDVSSGLKEIKLFQYNVNGEKIGEVSADSKNLQDGIAKFTIALGFEGTLKAEVVDNTGRTSGEVLANTENSNIGEGNVNGYMMLEDNPSEVSAITDADLTDVRREVIDGKIIYSDDAKLKFTAQDAGSGLYEIDIQVNEANYPGYPLYFSNQDRDEHEYIIDTSKVTAKDDGSYVVKVKVTDNAGTVVTKELTVYKDATSATIKGFDFNLNQNIDVDKEGKELYEAVEVKDYGFYFKENVVVSITAEDIKSSNETASGVDSITYKAIDVDGTVKYQGDQIPTVNNKISFTIDKDFKGQIYAYATDKIGNNPQNSSIPKGYKPDEDGFVHPNGSVVESAEKHKKTSFIQLNMPSAVGTQNTAASYRYTGPAKADAELAYNTSKKVPLYNADITFGIHVSDSYSGIREIKWTIIEGEKTTVKQITVDNKGRISGDTSGWSLEKENGSNLVVTLKNSAVKVSGNANDMVVLVELTDRTGNMSYDYYVFGIDKTAPTIAVSYDNNRSSTQYSGDTYFNADRTATIVIEERNFDASKVNITVNKDGAKYPVNLTWSTVAGSGNKDNTKHIAAIPYKTDGDYTFTVEYTDNAQNKNNGVNYGNSLAPQKFTIDKTAPVIAVSYSNNSAANAKYFKAARTATVTVTEHNFDLSRVSVSITASKDGASIAVPRPAWSSNGDVHTAIILYSADGDYTFDMHMSDMAGNENNPVNFGASVAPKDFTVDTHIEKPAITGIENGKAYKENVIPAINFEDINYDSYTATLLRTRMDEKNVDVTNQFITSVVTSARGGHGISDTFENKQENDGIYTLTVRMQDKAANEESVSVTFSVNRYGSVYVYDEYLSSLLDSYVQKVGKSIVITEYNPDQLVEGSLKVDVTRDGSPVSNVGYTVNPVINNQVAIGESGWYQYAYTIVDSNFKADGIYKIAVSSEDIAGNKPENTNYEDKNILFRVDTTKPELTSISGLENNLVNDTSLHVTIKGFDAIGLKKVMVYVDGKMMQAFENFDDLINFTGSFDISEGINRKVRIVMEDMAGNVLDTDSNDFNTDYAFERSVTVSTNFFVRWYANPWLFWGSIIGVVLLSACIIIFIVVKKKKQSEE